MRTEKCFSAHRPTRLGSGLTKNLPVKKRGSSLLDELSGIPPIFRLSLSYKGVMAPLLMKRSRKWVAFTFLRRDQGNVHALSGRSVATFRLSHPYIFHYDISFWEELAGRNACQDVWTSSHCFSRKASSQTRASISAKPPTSCHCAAPLWLIAA